jgi:anti-sigma factor RsiW
MMNDSLCTYAGRREEVLVAYLYDEADFETRATFDRHLTTCAQCRTELQAFRGVRAEMGRWSSPELVDHVNVTFGRPAPVPLPSGGFIAAMRQVPAWAQVAAAVLFVGVAAGVANLHVTYGQDGLTVRTGWSQSAPAVAVAPAVDPANPPWRSDLAALEQQIRSELEARPVPTAAPAGDETTARRVNLMLQESERRQQSELALRLAELMRDVQSQRQADLMKIERSLGVIQSRTGQTGIEVMRTQRQVNSLAQQVSQRP